jgi:hypothetical protein
MRMTLAVVLVVICLSAVARIGVSVVDYQVKMMDLNAPTINTKPSPIPAPRRPHSDFPPVFAPVQPQTPCYADDACKARTVVFI